MTTLSTATALLLWLSTQNPTASAAPPPLEVRHVPVAQVAAGQELVLEADITPASQLGELTVHHRLAGETEFRQTAFGRNTEGRYAAIIPLPADRYTPVEYYVTARDAQGAQSPRFASAELPHTVLIQVPDKLLERDAVLKLHGGNRSRVAVSAEYVDFGSSRAGTVRYVDRYYRLETDYLYRLLTDVGGMRVDGIRIGVGHLRARVPGIRPPVPPNWPPLEGPPPTLRTGLDYGFSELDVALSPLFGVAGRLLLGGNAEGFAAGMGGRLRIGRPRGSRVELEAETISGLGSSGTVRLGWDTVPRIPMSAAVQVTSFPSGPSGVRLLYRADLEVSEAFTLGAVVGYQARISISGGPTLGLATSYAW